jgi:4'-phosphopantetheinyl transferase
MANARNISDPAFQIESPLALPDNEVQVWRADLDALAPHEERWRQLLASDELTRAARFHFAGDRQRYTAARALLRIILSGYLKTNPLDLEFCYSKKEKPSLAQRHAESNIQFNVSHSGGIALYAFAWRRELGIDVEKINPDVEVAAIARRFFSEHEQKQLLALPSDEQVEAFFRCWTRKEAYIKATGDGLSLPLSQFDVSLEPGSTDALVATRPDSQDAGQWQLRDVYAGEGYLGAVCVRDQDWRISSWE